MPVFLLEGNISVGKSSLLPELNWLSTPTNVQCFEEPVALWRNVAETDLLKESYSRNKTSFLFMMQTYVMNTTAQLYMENTKDPKKVTFFERSIYSAFHVFTANNFKTGLLTPTEFAILEQQFLFLQQQTLKPDAIIYLKCEPEVAFDRMNKRQSVESDLIPLDYLQALHERHENWLMDPDIGIPVHVIDANKSKASVQQSCLELLNTLF